MAGTGIYTYHLSEELSQRHDVHVFYPTYGNEAYLLNNFERDGLRIHELSLPYNLMKRIKKNVIFKSCYIIKNVEEKFEQILDKVAPDVVHFQHLIRLSASLIEVAKKREIPTVLTLHDYWFICPTIQLLKSDYSTCSGPDEQAENCFECWNKRQAEVLANYLARHPIPQNIFKKLLESDLRIINRKKKFLQRKKFMKSLLLKIDKLIALSKFLRDFFIEHGVPANKIDYLTTGYDLSLFKGFRKKEKMKKKLIFGFVGGIAKHKGVDVLIDAFVKLPRDDAELRIYGHYNPENNRYHKKLAKKSGDCPNIKFIGSFEDVKQPYSEIDVLIFPSIWYENFPFVLKEAKISNTPIIGSNIGAIPEFIEVGKNGFLFEAGNSEDLYKKMCMILDNPKLVDELRRGAEPAMSIQKHAEEIKKIYRMVIRDKNKRPR